MKNVNLLVAVIFIITGCNQGPESASLEVSDQALVHTTPKEKTATLIERKLIKEGRVVFETDDLNSSRETIFKAIEKHDAYISSDREHNSHGQKSNTLTIRVPIKKFDDFLRDAALGVKKFEQKEINVKDVTEEFLDIDIRLKTKKKLEQRYLDLLKQARNVSEILEIERELEQLRTAIELIEGRLNYLENNSSFSTLSITFFETVPHKNEFLKEFKNGFKNGWENLIWFFVMLINIWPFILILFTGIIGLKLYNKKT